MPSYGAPYGKGGPVGPKPVKTPEQLAQDHRSQQQYQHQTAMQDLMRQQSQGNVNQQASQTRQITPTVNPVVVGAGSGPDITQGAYEGLLSNTHSSNLQAGAENRRWGMFQPLIDRFTSNSSSSSTSGAGQPVQHVNLPGIGGAEDAARRAVLARAQDTAGQTGRAAMNSLSDIMGSRGLSGSGLHMGDASDIISAGAQGVGEVNREQQIQGLDNARQRASEQYQGDITQRGQDIAQQQFASSKSEAASTRNQSMLMQLLSQLTSRY